MRWSGDPVELERWCVETPDLRAFREAMDSVPPHLRAPFATRLRRALTSVAAAEPSAGQLRRDTPLIGRLTSPSAVLLRQVRLEKLRLLDAVEER